MAIFSPTPSGTAQWRSERLAAATFGIYLAVAIPILLHLGSHYWFMGDEWAFFVGGSIADPAVLFRPIHTHWSTLPILAYRALYNVFGLNSYLPFQLCVILLHLTLCYLLRVIMRRAGVGPWVATICAAALVLFGSAEVNILAGVQLSQVGSMVLGLLHLILADRDGRIERRDWLGLTCGLGSIMSSGMGPPLVAIVGIAVLCRRGWRPALFHTLPLAIVYIAWSLSTEAALQADTFIPPLEFILKWIFVGQSGVFLALGGYGVVAAALATILVVGTMLAWIPLALPVFRQRASLPAAMLFGALVMQAVICLGRWTMGLEAASSDRYVGVMTALTLPALAVAADALVRRWQWLMLVVCALLLVGIVSNITRFGSIPISSPQAHLTARTNMLAVAYSPLADQAPADLVPIPHLIFGGEVNMALLLQARKSSRLPPPPEITANLKSQTELRLSIQELAGPIPADLTCESYAEPVALKPKVGDLYGLMTPVRISLGGKARPLTYNSVWSSYPVIRVMRPDLTIHFTPKSPATSFSLCF